MSEHPLIEKVFNDMKVYDSAGGEIGKVDDVRLPGATSGGQGIFAPKIPDTVRHRYEATGYFHVDGKGWIDTDRFVLASEIDRVDGQSVYLNVAKEKLPEG